MNGRKLLSLALALALVESITFPAHAELLKNFKTDGSIETRSFAIDNEIDRNGTADDYRSETRTRLMVGGSFDVLDDVHARVGVTKNNRVFGNPNERVTDGFNTSASANLFVENAYVKVDKVFGRVDLTMGRQYYGDPNDPVIYFGPNNDDVLSVAALDAFRTDADLGGVAKFQGLYAKVADNGGTGAFGNFANTPTRGSDTDNVIFGGEVNTDKLVPQGNLGVYYYTDQIKNTKTAPATGNNTLNVAGVRAKGDILGGLGYHAEFIQNFGRNNAIAAPAGGSNAYHGNAYIVGLNYGRDLQGAPVHAKLEYARGSDDFATIAASTRYGIIWGEHTAFAGPSTINRGVNGTAASLSNVKVLTAGIGASPIVKLSVDLNAYRFRYDANLGGLGTSAGTEYDLIVGWKHSDNVAFEVNAATFQVGTSLQNTPPNAVAPTNPITRLGADVKIKF